MVDRNPTRLQGVTEVGVELLATSAAEAARPGGWDAVDDDAGVVAATEDGPTQVRYGGTVSSSESPDGRSRQLLTVPDVHRRNHHRRVDGGADSYARAVDMFTA